MTTWVAVALSAGCILAALGLWMLLLSSRIRRHARPAPLERADAIVVFGAAVWAGGPSLSLRVRTEKAAKLYSEGWAPAILCSGGWSGGASEAVAMRGLLLEAGVPAEAIIPDDGGTSTRKTIRSAQGFARALGWKRLIAVSSGYHMHRIALEARRLDLDVMLCPALRSGSRDLPLLAFDLRQHLREIAALARNTCFAPIELLCRRGPGRWMQSALWNIRARVRWLFSEADAVAEAQEIIGDRIKQAVAKFSDTATVATPAAASLGWPVPGEVTSRFGIRYRRLHAGLDLRAGYGSPICASADGQVLLAERLGPYGNVTVIHHGAGLATLYAHQAGLAVSAGQTVKCAQRIGYAGETGRSFGAHLHFEVRVHGTPVDPLAYLSNR